MGLLDDAIREHLDLKRRRGADPAEVERAEQEALGPVRRNREAGTAEDLEAVLVPGEPEAPSSAYDEPDEPVASDLLEEHELAFEDDEPAFDAPRRPVSGARSAPADEDADPEPFDDATRLMRPVAAPDPTASSHEDELHEDDEDVLEETPEFLQDTPDHDRLWFEQRPPRDFDFDN